MPSQEPAAVVGHDQWTAVPGTPFELYQASGTNLCVHVVDGELAFDVDGPVRIRLNRSGLVIREYGIRMHPNPTVKEAPTMPSVSIVLSEHQARTDANGMNALAAGPEGKRYWVLLAEPVTRQRVIAPGEAGEVLTPWVALAEENSHA